MATPNKPSKSLFLRHQLKSLNLALILYLCFGAFLFDQIGDFSTTSSPKLPNSVHKQIDKGSVAGMVSLADMRLNSVRKMWNITNQLNILYESNWTSLVLEELVSFEQQLMDSIQKNPLDELEELELEAEKKKNNKLADNKEAQLRLQKRTKSIKKSIIHSVATITTIGSPNGRPKSQTAKLATILYGCLGIPLFFVTISQTGKHLAHSSLNSLIVIRHYCFKLPSYYLCCSCSPYECFKWLSWCCCCCCCCCRFLFCITDSFFKTTKREPPILRVRKRIGQKSGPPKMEKIQQTGRSNSFSNNSCPPRVNLQKSVRFDNSETNCTSFATNNALEELDEALVVPNTGDDFQYSWGVFKTSSFLLVIYFFLGAYYFAQSGSISLIDSMYDCYVMLSMSELPKAFNLEPIWNPMTFYQSLSSNLAKNPAQLITQATDSQAESVAEGFLPDKLILNILYMIVGLNLISMCAHFAKLCYNSQEQQMGTMKEGKPEMRCNGNIATVMGSYENNNLFTDSQGQPPASTSAGSMAIIEKTAQQPQYGCLYQTSAAISSSGASTSGVELDTKGQEQVNLAELFVVNQVSPGQSFGYSQQQQQTQQIVSDVSFASDRSTNSLCLHHQQAKQQQQQQHQQPASPSNAILGSVYQPSCELGTIQRRANRALGHHQLADSKLSQSHLYIPQTMLANNNTYDDDEASDANEMERMLKSCLNQSGEPQHQQVVRSSSSSVQLSQHMNGNRISSSDDPNESYSSQHIHSGAAQNISDQDTFGTRSFGGNQRNISLRALGIPMGMIEANGCELDSSPNTMDTNSNTISSIASRTIKLADQKPNRRSQQLPTQNGYLYLSDESTNPK